MLLVAGVALVTVPQQSNDQLASLSDSTFAVTVAEDQDGAAKSEEMAGAAAPAPTTPPTDLSAGEEFADARSAQSATSEPAAAQDDSNVGYVTSDSGAELSGRTTFEEGCTFGVPAAGEDATVERRWIVVAGIEFAISCRRQRRVRHLFRPRHRRTDSSSQQIHVHVVLKTFRPPITPAGNSVRQAASRSGSPVMST